MLLLRLAACGLSTTGPDGMVGRVLDADGAPLVGLEVQTLEAGAVTDPAGAFAVPYKAPDHTVRFERGGLWWAREYRAGVDDRTTVEIRLPPTSALTVACPEEACDLALRWAAGEGLDATLRAVCAPGRLLPLGGAPAGVPEGGCTVGKGTAATALPLELSREADRLRLLPPAVPLRVEIHAADGPLPSDCLVQVGREMAQSDGQGSFTAAARGEVLVSALCSARPIVPARWRPGDPTSIGLDWSDSGPDLDLERLAPWASIVVLSAGGISFEVHPDDDGRFLLPALPPGRWAVEVLGEGADLPDGPVPPEDPAQPADVLVLRAAGGERLVGAIRVEQGTTGPLRAVLVR